MLRPVLLVRDSRHLGESGVAVSYTDAKIEVEGLLERVLELRKKLAAATVPADTELHQQQIEATDRQIDALVYELYGLTEEEIGVVEGLDHE